VIPFYNEEALAHEVIVEWLETLEALRVSFELRLYDDGSGDRTPEILEQLAAGDPRVIVVRQANRGHGPTILRGYRDAQGEWIFQADGDGEVDPGDLGRLWELRDRADLVLGRRIGRPAAVERTVVTAAARLAVRWLYGGQLHDTNVPFRLMRRSAVIPLLAMLPEHPFAPNVLICGLAGRAGLRLREVPVDFRPRRAEPARLRRGRLWVNALRVGRDAVLVAWRSR